MEYELTRRGFLAASGGGAILLATGLKAAAGQGAGFAVIDPTLASGRAFAESLRFGGSELRSVTGDPSAIFFAELKPLLDDGALLTGLTRAETFNCLVGLACATGPARSAFHILGQDSAEEGLGLAFGGAQSLRADPVSLALWPRGETAADTPVHWHLSKTAKTEAFV